MYNNNYFIKIKINYYYTHVYLSKNDQTLLNIYIHNNNNNLIIIYICTYLYV